MSLFLRFDFPFIHGIFGNGEGGFCGLGVVSGTEVEVSTSDDLIEENCYCILNVVQSSQEKLLKLQDVAIF